MSPVEHKQPWRTLTPEQRQARRRVLSEDEIRTMVRARLAQERAEKRITWLVVLLSVCGLLGTIWMVS